MKIDFTSRFSRYTLAAIIGVIAIALYGALAARYAFPGESAQILAVWRGLDVAALSRYPLMKSIATHLSVSNALAPFLGAIAAMLFFLLSDKFFTFAAGRDLEKGQVLARASALIGTAIFMTTPSVLEAATHLEPRLFALVWALLTICVLDSTALLPKWAAYPVVLVSGVMAGLGFGDSPLFLVLLPLLLILAGSSASRGGRNVWPSTTLFLLSFIATFAIVAANSDDGLVAFARDMKSRLVDYTAIKGWLVDCMPGFIALLSLLAAKRAVREQGGWVTCLFHVTLTIIAILATATELSPSAHTAPYAILSVTPSAYAAFAAGYVMFYWLVKTRRVATERIAKLAGYIAGGALVIVSLVTACLNLFSFEPDRGAFADKIAEEVLEEMGDREWLVTDGSIDNHILIAAERLGRKVRLVALHRDLDERYIARLKDEVRKEGLGGAKNRDLLMSLDLGVLPFVQDWFAADPSIKDRVAVWGAADLFVRAGLESVPEFMIFGADSSRAVDWRVKWEKYDSILHAPEGWGSYRLSLNKNPIDRFRLDLRRHAGLVANNKGVWFADAGKMDEACEMFELVLEKIDSDNICSLLNEFELDSAGVAKARKNHSKLESKLKAIVADTARRYREIPLSIHYGYIRSSEMYARYGMSWARSGRPGEAIVNFGRAIDLVPSDRRTSLLNMMAAVYASELEHSKSREIYSGVLEKDASNREALLGMMRLEIMDGNVEKAIEYLERANAVSGDDPRAYVEKAMLHLMKGNIAEAKALLRGATDAQPGNLQAWSFLAAATIQEIDAEKNKTRRDKLIAELENEILATMEKQARSPADYYVQTTRAFLLMRKTDAKRSKEEHDSMVRAARDALVAAQKDRPDIQQTSDMILGMDISLNDTVEAEAHAIDALRRNRKAPLANYVMGSLALKKGNNADAEAYLRKAADIEKPVPLALNDLAEVLRREKRYDEALSYARKAAKAAPELYVVYDTLGSILVAKGELDEAERAVNRACELSRDENGRESDIRMLISLARVQFAKDDALRARATLRKVQRRADELTEFELKEYEELKGKVK